MERRVLTSFPRLLAAHFPLPQLLFHLPELRRGESQHRCSFAVCLGSAATGAPQAGPRAIRCSVLCALEVAYGSSASSVSSSSQRRPTARGRRSCARCEQDATIVLSCRHEALTCMRRRERGFIQCGGRRRGREGKSERGGDGSCKPARRARAQNAPYAPRSSTMILNIVKASSAVGAEHCNGDVRTYTRPGSHSS